ncbi:MAG: aspartyl protease family protein [Candidatus Bathyarchaeia archaeon]
MGYTKVKGIVTCPSRTKALELEFLVDTGAGYMVLPPAIAKVLGLESIMKTKAILANKAEVEADYSSAYVKVMDREVPVPVLVIDSPMPLLGAFTLHVLGLEVDPVKEEIKPSRPFALGLL